MKWLNEDGQPMTKRELVAHFAHKLIGKEVSVVKIGDYKPKLDPRNIIYVPFPEYGVGLVYVKEENDDAPV